MMFAGAAVIPAIVVALFFGLLVTRGVDSWFSAPIRTLVDSSTMVSRAYMQDHRLGLAANTRDAAAALEPMQGMLANDPDGFRLRLEGLVSQGYFDAIYVIGSHGKVLAKAEGASGKSYPLPSDDKMRDAVRDIVVNDTDVHDSLTSLFRLRSYPDAYLYGIRRVDPAIYGLVKDTSDASAFYAQVDKNRARIQSVFQLSNAETALLVLVGAIAVGMAVANSISRPVARLVEAADQVAEGDLSARVPEGESPEEIEVLSQAFNRMASDLQAQQAALKTASVEAESRRQFIETVLSGVSAGVLSLDDNGCISACNRQAVKLLGLRHGFSNGVPLTDAAPELAAVMARAGEGGEAEMDVDVTRAGEVRRLRIRASQLAEGGLVLTFDDITRLMSAQRNAAWRDVARRIAHEIKNPLTPIRLSAERLRRKYRKDIVADVEIFDRCTDTIIRQVDDIGRMVDEFSAFARMPAPQFTRCDPAEMLRQAVFARRVADADIAVELIEPVPQVSLVCDERMVGQALNNVLKNAAEAIAARRLEGAGVGGRIVARLMSDAENVSFEVTDNGVGLPARDRDRLIEPYVTTREKGTGLGLAIVKRIAEEHGGSLTLTDAPQGPGARVILTFPQVRVVAPSAPIAQEA